MPATNAAANTPPCSPSAFLTHSVISATVVESTIIGILGTIAGFGLGLLVLGWVMTAVTADVFPDLGTIISLAPTTVATAAVLGIAAVGLAPLLGARGLRHLRHPLDAARRRIDMRALHKAASRVARSTAALVPLALAIPMTALLVARASDEEA